MMNLWGTERKARLGGFLLFGLLLVLVVESCVFDPNLSEYPPCSPEGLCAPTCVCLEQRVCVPGDRASRDMPPAFCHPDNTCGADLMSDVNHCGRCDEVCEFAHATASCDLGVCVMGDCGLGWADCDGQIDNGCEADLSLPEHCGSCLVVCTEQLPLCQGRTCVAACEDPYTTCGGACVDLQTDLNHCGLCERACAPVHASDFDCVGGECRVMACDAGYGLCGADYWTGCSTVFGTLENCRVCYDTCGTDHATAQCLDSGCVIDCESGWGDCNGNPADGCEEPLGSQIHCTGCWAGCEAGTPCLGVEIGCEQTPCSQTCALGIECINGVCGGEGLYCFGEPCLGGACCMDSLGSGICSPTGSCEELLFAELHCDSSLADCEEGFICCMINGAWHETALCTTSCAFEEILCATDAECLGIPGRDFVDCCHKAGSFYGTCSDLNCD